MILKGCDNLQKAVSARTFLKVAILLSFISSSLLQPTMVEAAVKITPCTHSSLSPKVGKSGAAAGTTYINLMIINHSKTSCSLIGIPSAQTGFLSYSQTPFVPVGLPASKVSYQKRGGTVWLPPHATASVEFSISTASNYPAKKCIAKNVSMVRITFTSGNTLLHLLYPLSKVQVCTKIKNTFIAGVVLGTRFP